MNRVFKIFILCSVIWAGRAWAQDDSLNILFIGNSHTYYNDLPHLFSELAASGGKTVTTDMSAPGGYTLEQHTTNPTTLEKIAQGGWDYVVLQEQSQYPVIEYYRFNSMYPAARHLDSLITVTGAETVFFMTWGWRYGGLHTINGHSSPNFVDYFQMQDSVSVAYREIANELGAVLVPAGDAWATARHQDTTIIFWQPDTYHPTLAGSYLAACVFYAVLFNETPIGLTYNPGLDPNLLPFLQRAADLTVSKIVDEPVEKPGLFEFFGNYPNPFNGSTNFQFELAMPSHVVISIFDIMGRRLATIADGEYSSGKHSITWDGRNTAGLVAASGRYYVIARTDDEHRVLPITLIK